MTDEPKLYMKYFVLKLKQKINYDALRMLLQAHPWSKIISGEELAKIIIQCLECD